MKQFFKSFYTLLKVPIVEKHRWAYPTSDFMMLNEDYNIYLFPFSLVLLVMLGTILILFEFRWQSAEPRGCRKLGSRPSGHIKDHKMVSKSGSGQQKCNGVNSWRVANLWIYPVKSCRAVELDHGLVLGSGMQYDRQFSFAQLLSTFPVSSDPSQARKQDHIWSFITQRQRPQLARVRTEIWIPDSSSRTYSESEPNVQSQGVLVIIFPRFDGFWGWATDILFRVGIGGFERSFQVPLDPTAEQIKQQNYVTNKMKIWKDSPESIIMASTSPSDENLLFKELSRFLGITNSLALFRAAQTPNREVYRCAPKKEEIGYQARVAFQDAYPLHMINVASVRDVGRKLIKGSPKLSVMQFRPNIVITGPKAYHEDDWKKIKIGDFEYFVCCRTARCLLPNVDQNTGIKDKFEPNKTLRATRDIDPGATPHACLGMQMVPALEESVIRVGDTIQILETGEHFYLYQ